MTDDARSQRVEVSRRELEQLLHRGRRLRETPAVDTLHAWQCDSAALIHRLSGGTKAHWLARAYSEAFLVPPGDRGGHAAEARTVQIVDRVLAVLERADESLSRIADADAPLDETSAPSIPRFDFVREAALRPVLEQALRDSARSLENGDYTSALMTSCVILEAIITDALQSRVPNGVKVGDWSFAARIAAAEKAGLIRGGCARLPSAARTYRDDAPPAASAAPGVSERDARLTGQVLLVIMRDLNPGR